MPTVSILVPVYKAEKTLDACVESILAQSYADFELLLIDACQPRPLPGNVRCLGGKRPPHPRPAPG